MTIFHTSVIIEVNTVLQSHVLLNAKLDGESGRNRVMYTVNMSNQLSLTFAGHLTVPLFVLVEDGQQSSTYRRNKILLIGKMNVYVVLLLILVMLLSYNRMKKEGWLADYAKYKHCNCAKTYAEN